MGRSLIIVSLIKGEREGRNDKNRKYRYAKATKLNIVIEYYSFLQTV